MPVDATDSRNIKNKYFQPLATGKPKLLPSVGIIESGIHLTSYDLPCKPFDSNTRAAFDGICLIYIIQGPFQSKQQNITHVLGASFSTNAITQSPNFSLASC
ncbi:MAG: hypothetical protein EZS28_009765 [Streblomastix strix]|uniref:Uncharacterized protein n=1 Tax=Streblomastix strix TaxID=222440 RepID=A0A5J4WIK9_9EUKA|nr:MAG: hypothetical protein EZS28_009765 [Streblomastix strix]